MAGEDWTDEELAAAADAYRLVRAGRVTVGEACMTLMAGPLKVRSLNSVRRRLTHARMILNALDAGEGVDSVIERTHVGSRVAHFLAECLANQPQS